jgi:transcriptional regulator with XRE-family HTH domain
MKKQTYQSSVSASNQKLRQAFLDDPELIGELVDAAICNGIASDLYKLRIQAGMTQQQLAEILGIKQSNISRWETPGYQGYKIKVLSKIVRTLSGKLSIRIKPETTYSYDLKFTQPLAFKADSVVVLIDTGNTYDVQLTSKQNGYTFKGLQDYTHANC